MDEERTYDWIVVGGGSAGCVLAARLSQDPSALVLLLEGGPADRSAPVGVPPAWPSLIGSDADWGTMTVPGTFYPCVPRVGTWPRSGGFVLHQCDGHVRGHRSSYDAWAAEGLAGWDFESLLPYLKATESSPDRSAEWRGQDEVRTVR